MEYAKDSQSGLRVNPDWLSFQYISIFADIFVFIPLYKNL